MVSYYWEILSLIYRFGFELMRFRFNFLVYKKINSIFIILWRGKRYLCVVVIKIYKEKKILENGFFVL